jgi:hypothetical protein
MALYAYNHAQWYVAAVLAMAQRYVGLRAKVRVSRTWSPADPRG